MRWAPIRGRTEVASYSAQELARAFRRVRANTISVAEDIPADRYGFSATPDTRSVEKVLVHVAVSPRMQEGIHRERVMDFSTLDVRELFFGILAVEAESHTKADVLDLLRAEGERFGSFLDGSASLVVGPHTHTPTADHQILPGGTAFMSDAAMCGDYDSVLGMEKDEPLRRFIRKIPGGRFEPATGEGTLCGLAVETDDKTGLAVKIAPVRIGPRLEPAQPSFW